MDNVSIKILEHLASGHGHKRVADILGVEQEEYLKLFYSLLMATKCWDEIQLGTWWEEHRDEHVTKTKDNVTSLQ